MKNREDLESKDEEIADLKGKRVQQDRVIQQLNNELERKNQDVNDFKKKMGELKESRTLLDRQSAELIQIKNENRDLINQQNDFKGKTSQLSGDKEYKQLLNQVREQEISISQIEKNNSLLQEENEHLRIQIQDQKQEVRDFQEKLTISKKEIQQLKDEKDQQLTQQMNERFDKTSVLDSKFRYDQQDFQQAKNNFDNQVYLNKGNPRDN